MELIEKREPRLRPEDQILIHDSEQLEPCKMLKETSICNNSTLHLVIRLRGGPACTPLDAEKLSFSELLQDYTIILDELKKREKRCTDLEAEKTRVSYQLSEENSRIQAQLTESARRCTDLEAEKTRVFSQLSQENTRILAQLKKRERRCTHLEAEKTRLSSQLSEENTRIQAQLTESARRCTDLEAEKTRVFSQLSQENTRILAQLAEAEERCSQLEQERDETRLVAEEAQRNLSIYEDVVKVPATEVEMSDVKLGRGAHGGK